MKRLAALLLLWTTPAEAQAPRWTADLGGIYEGQIFVGKAMVPGTTRFTIDALGTVSGSYSYREPGAAEEKGELVNCATPAPRKIGCQWRDRYGAGPVVFEFDDDVTSFQGFWFTAKVRKQGMPWVGRKRVEG
jgi:hypothetical protein